MKRIIINLKVFNCNKKSLLREQVEQGLFPYFDLLCEAINPIKSRLSLKFSFITIYNNLITDYLSD